MINVITSFLTSFTQIEYVSLMFVAIAVTGLVALVRRVIMFDF